MSDQETKTKEYRRPMPADWWLKKRTYSLFMVRELTCVFVGGYSLILLILASRIGDQESVTVMLNSKTLSVLQLIALPMVIYHTVTWLNLTPKVLVLWRGEERVNPLLIAAVHYVAWIGISIVILCVVFTYG
jgi:fumarate reductase subunit C